MHLVLNLNGFAFYRDFIFAEILKLLNANIIIHLHSKGVNETKQNGFKKMLYTRAFKSSSVIHLDKSLESDICYVRDKSKRLYFVSNGIPDDSLIDLVKSKNAKVQILFLSNLMPSKGAHILLQAINGLSADLDNLFELVIVGETIDGNYTKNLESLVGNRHRDNIKFLGPRHGGAKLEILRYADIFVLPTKNDCFPISILEAMSHSLAIVSTYQGAIPSIVEDGVNGFLFDGSTVEVLTEILNKYICDLKLLSSHQVSARQRFLKNYNLDGFESALIKVLKEELRVIG